MSEFKYTSIDRVLAMVSPFFNEADLNEGNIIEWAGEALDFLQVESVKEESIAFLEVKNHQASVPKGFQMVLEIARKRDWTAADKEKSCCPQNIVNELCGCKDNKNDCKKCCDDNPNYILTDCEGNIIGDYDIAYYRPYFDLQWEYHTWSISTYHRREWTPVTLSDHTLFNSLVAKNKTDRTAYYSNSDEYTIVGTVEKCLRFSFEEGYIALSYLKTPVDKETGYPLIPDDVRYLTAIKYFVIWKITEWYQLQRREGYDTLVKEYEAKWLRYAKQAKNYAKMPKSLDDYQSLLEQTFQLVPRLTRYYGFFGKIRRYDTLDYYGWNRHYKP